MGKDLVLGTIEYKQFKDLSFEYLKQTLDRLQMTESQAANGLKTLSLLRFSRTNDWTAQELEESRVILKLVTGRAIEVQLAHAWRNKFGESCERQSF